MINAIKIALSGLQAAAKKTEAVASNIANLHSGGQLDGSSPSPYRAQTVAQTPVVGPEGTGGGVAANIQARNPGFVPSYAPDSPFADEKGYIGVPDLDLASEAVTLQMAETAFKANLAVLETAADMEEELLERFDKKV